MFRRRGQGGRHGKDAGEAYETDTQAAPTSGEAGDTAAGESPVRLPASRPLGPWDAAELDEPVAGRADLGGIMIPIEEGMELRVEVQNDQIVAATAVTGDSAIQLQAFAAPRSEGIWAEVRTEIAASITQQGGLVDQQEGPLGTELRAQVPVQLDDGNQGVQVLRFVGCDGPRWFLRGVVSGQAAAQPQTGGPVEQIFRGTVVVRGGDPMAPRDPIPLRLPQQVEMPDENGKPAEHDLNPFQRGPEITEVR